MSPAGPAGTLLSLRLSEAGGALSFAVFHHSVRENDHGQFRAHSHSFMTREEIASNVTRFA